MSFRLKSKSKIKVLKPFLTQFLLDLKDILRVFEIPPFRDKNRLTSFLNTTGGGTGVYIGGHKGVLRGAQGCKIGTEGCT